MKLRSILSLLALGAAALAARAEVLSPAQALERLAADSSAELPEGLRKAAARKATQRPFLTVERAGEPCAYTFRTDGGFMVLSAESQTEPLLGYSDHLAADAEELPPALRMLMDTWTIEIEALRAGDVISTPGAETAAAADDYPRVSSICKTRWNQNAPYNDLCPTVNGRRSPTGCVATAMAQVLKVYEYPTQCVGGNWTYLWRQQNENLSLNFNVISFDWSQMANTYANGTSAPEVAKLMRALGYAAEMNYTEWSSGTYAQALIAGLVRNFDFDCTLTYEKRDWQPLAVWQKKIYDVIASGYPVYYDGSTPDYSAGHAFVVDGYSSNGLFHINWGWGGLSDGYFRLSALDPASQGIGGSTQGYDVEQGAIFGLKPGDTTPHADAPLNFWTNAQFRAAVSSAILGGDPAKLEFVDAGMYNNGPLIVAQVYAAVKLSHSDGNVSYIKSDANFTNLAINSGFPYFYIRFPKTLPEGVYQVSPAVFNPSTDRFYDVNCSIGRGGSFTASVSGGAIYFRAPARAKLTTEDLNVLPAIYPSTPYKIKANLTNNTALTYSGAIFAKLCRPNYLKVLAELGAFSAEVGPGETLPIDITLNMADDLTPGTYDFVLYDINNVRISESVEVTVAGQPTGGQPRCDTLAVSSTAADSVTINYELSSTGGDYSGNVHALVYRSTSPNKTIAEYVTPLVSITQGQTVSGSLTFEIEKAVVGRRYGVRLCYYNGDDIVNIPGNSKVAFVVTEPVSAIQAVQAPVVDGPVEYFDLSGRRVANPRSGIFIRRQGSNSAVVRL